MLLDENFDKNNLFFTADIHFFHKNIIQYCKRPFENTFGMNNSIVNNWNNVVPKNGITFILGDVSLNSNPKYLETILRSLNGDKYLIIGNHERDALKKENIRNIWKGIYDIAEIFIRDEQAPLRLQHIVMCHYPMITWNGSHRNSWQLFGHVHGGLNNKNILSPTQIDVGMDCHNYTPISYTQVNNIIKTNYEKNRENTNNTSIFE